MTEIFDLFFYAIKTMYHVLSEQYILTVYGFTFSLWDFLFTIFILSALVPLVSYNIGGSGVSGLVGYIFKSQSERIKNERELANQRAEERIRIQRIEEIRSYLRASEARHNYANHRGLPDKGDVIYGRYEEHKKLK